MKGSIVADFLIFMAGIIVLLVLLSTVFGKGIAYSALGFAAEAEPGHLSEELRTFMIAGTTVPGDFEAGIQMTTKYNITTFNKTIGGIFDYEYLNIKPEGGGVFRTPPDIAYSPGACSVDYKTILTGSIEQQIFYATKRGNPCVVSTELKGIK